MPTAHRRRRSRLDEGPGAYDDVSLSTLFAHLMKLADDEAEATCPGSASGTTDPPTTPPSPPYFSSSALADNDTLFKRHSATVRRWMKHAVEDLHVDALIVVSATTLALQYLRHRHRFPSSRGTSIHHRRLADAWAHARSYLPTAYAGSCATGAPSLGARQQRELSGSGKKGQGQGITAKMLSITCLHLASKYHSVYEEKVANFGTILNPQTVFNLGLDISLSMGTVLNASFRANPVTLQSLFCAIGKESPVVCACSEWVALCLVLLPHPRVGDGDLRSASQGPEASNPATSIGTIGTPSSKAAPRELASTIFPGMSFASLASSSPCDQIKQQDDRRWSSPDVVWCRLSLALGAIVLARRLARSEGPCLPVHVQHALGLGNARALGLVANGILAARRAFEEGEEEDMDGTVANVEREGNGGDGSGAFAGGMAFGRLLDGAVAVDAASTTIEKTLLEWVTACEDDSPICQLNTADGDDPSTPEQGAHATLDSLPPDATLKRRGSGSIDDGSVDFVRGFSLAVEGVNTAGSDNSMAYSSSCRSNSVSNTGTSTIEGKDGSNTGNESASSVSSSVRNGPTPSYRSPSTSGSRRCEDSSFWTAYGGEKSLAGTSTSYDEEGSQSPYSPPSPLTMSGIKAMRESIPWNLRTPADQCSSPYYQHDEEDPGAPLFFLSSDQEINGDDDRLSPSPHRPLSPLVPLSTGCGILASQPGATDRGPAGRKRDAAENSNDCGRKGSFAVNKRPKSTTSSESLSSQRLRLLRSASNPEEERDARCKIMIDRLVVALELDCGCSFCNLRGGGDPKSRMGDGDEGVVKTNNPLPSTAAFSSCAQGFTERTECMENRAATAGTSGRAKMDSSIDCRSQYLQEETATSGTRPVHDPLLRLSAAEMSTHTPSGSGDDLSPKYGITKSTPNAHVTGVRLMPASANSGAPDNSADSDGIGWAGSGIAGDTNSFGGVEAPLPEVTRALPSSCSSSYVSFAGKSPQKMQDSATAMSARARPLPGCSSASARVGFTEWKRAPTH